MELNAVQMIAPELIIAVIGIFLGYKCIALKKNNMNYFMRFIFVLDFFLLVNIPIRIVELHLVRWNREFVFWLYAVSVLSMAFLTYYWLVFVLRQIGSKLINAKWKINAWSIPALSMIPVCVVNRWTGWLYTIDEYSWYHRGSIFIMQSALAYGYVIVLIICNTIHFFINEDKWAAKKFFVCIVPAMLGTALQFLYGGSYFLAGVTICALRMYVEICLDRQKAFEFSEKMSAINAELTHSNMEIEKNIRTILAVSDIYPVMYDVDLIGDSFSEIKAAKEFSDYSKQYSSAKEFLMNMPKTLFIKEDVGMLQMIYDPQNAVEMLDGKSSCFVDAREKVTNNWVRTTVVASERDEKGVATRLVFLLQNINELKEQQKKLEEAVLLEAHAKDLKEMFIQMAEALSGAIDAKDTYTHGHSVRVATYSRRIARMAGMSSEECEQIYFAGLLHDVGKIGIDNAIINKDGKLTDAEYEEMKKHPVFGRQILEKINRLPYLAIGANYHHEKYDGTGYPEGLKGEDIPEFARIIAVADAYDAMTSYRSYRDPLPQDKVRAEITRCQGTQFDPIFAKYMLQMIAEDKDYNMREHKNKVE